MTLDRRFPGRHAGRVAAVLAVGVLYGAARLPALSAGDLQQLAAGLRFTRHALPESPSGMPPRRVRAVHPSLERISAWISSVGASVALADLDGDGLANDACWVDTRTDDVIVAPVPGRAPAYAPFTLTPAPRPYSAATMAPTGCLPADLDEDGRLDVIVYYWGRTPILFQNYTAAGVLSAAGFRPRELVELPERWYTNAATTADVDGDGHLDVIIGNYFADGARILHARPPAEPEYGGGPPDGPQEMQNSMSRAVNGGRNRLLLCRPAVGEGVTCHDTPAFDDEVAHAWTLALGAADLDGDQLPEIYFANDFGSDRLLHNRSRPGAPAFTRLRGVKTLTTPNSKVLGHDSFKGMGVDFGDVNGDGVMDIYVSNIAATYALEESHFLFVGTGETARMREGVAPLRDRAEPLGLARSGWGWDARLVDFDDDGHVEALQALGFVRGQVNRWPELHELAMGNDTLLRRPASWPRVQPGDDLSGAPGNALFTRDARGIFFDVADLVGLEEREVTRGIAVADTDADGDLDFAFANQWGASSYYRNERGAENVALSLRLLLPLRAQQRTYQWAGARRPDGAGRAAVGATVTVEIPDAAGPRRLVAQVDGGSGHSGRRSTDVHFGLGRLEAGARVRVSLRWRDARGRVHAGERWLTAGWHTLVLGEADALEG